MGKKKSKTNRSNLIVQDEAHNEVKQPLLSDEGENEEMNYMNEDGFIHDTDRETFISDIELEHPMQLLARHQSNRSREIWCAIIALSGGILFFIIILAIFRAVETNGAHLPAKVPVFPTQYEGSVSLHMPYMNFIMPVYIHMDEDSGMQKLSYYGGTNTFLFNTNGPSYALFPRNNKMICIETNSVPMLQHIFPTNMSLFEPQRGLFYIGDRSCFTWKYTTQSTLGDANGLHGVYTLYVDEKTNEPIRFHYIGRNSMLGGSHIDEYYLDYEYLRKGSIPLPIFQDLPLHYNCTKQDENPNGPTYKPIEDMHLLFPESHPQQEQVFNDYQREHGKVYANISEVQTRKMIFHQNLRYINSKNLQGLSYHLRVNRFADMTHNERLGFYTFPHIKRNENNGADSIHMINPLLPSVDEFDWRKKGAVTPVKDQGTCGSCWTFGTTGAMEGALYILSNKLINLSQQNLMDCSWDYGNQGCNGGFDYQAYAYIKASGGLMSTETYGTYRNAPDFCKFNASLVVPHTKMSGFMNVTSIDALNDALQTIGPLSVSIDATEPDFYFYGGGYYNNPSCKNDLDSLDHSVLAVGFTTYRGKKYTIIKNSWSTYWGEDGYIKIAQENNICGVATAATYPVLS